MRLSRIGLGRLSIRTRITGGSVLVALVISVIAGVVIFDRVRHIVDEGEHDLLASIEAPYRTALLTEPSEALDVPGRGEHVAVIDPGGTAKVDSLPRALRDRRTELAALPDGFHVVTADGVTYLVRVAQVPTTAGTWYLLATRNAQEQATVLSQVSWLLVTAIALINVGFAAASWLTGTLALRPVTRLRRSAAELATRPGDELLPVGAADDEISRLARALNDLIAGLRASAERERQLVSDASHELRTPLAILQTQLELAQTAGGGEAQLRQDLAAAQVTLGRLSGLATSLLELSRIEAQSEPGRADYADLALELADAADRARLRVGDRPVTITTEVERADDETLIAVPVEDFGRIVDNLVGNAISAARENAVRIELVLGRRASGAVLRVRDDAGGMDPAFVDRALVRFARSSRGREGAGLGLAIVAGIARLGGGDVTLHNDPGRGLEVEVRFPLAPPVE
jgi:signal transduction histidine kinase